MAYTGTYEQELRKNPTIDGNFSKDSPKKYLINLVYAFHPA